MPDQTADRLKAWLSERGFESHWPLLAANEIDFETLLSLKYEHLRELGLSMGASIKLMKAVGESADGKPAPVADRPKDAERRQISAMFCDIVGYTGLSSRLDPEETRGLLHAYWRQIQETIATHEGYIAQYLGDGALIYFGYPFAREDDTERACSAALSLLRLLAGAETSAGAALRVRIGIATGVVVVGDNGTSKETLAVGHTINLAAKLQSLAKPGTVVIDEHTRRVVAGQFELEPLGLVDIPGIDHATHFYRLDESVHAGTRFEARHRRSDHAMVGREGETTRARELWQHARGGNGQVMQLVGEAGIGKSHFAFSLRAALCAEGYGVLQFDCSPRHVDSPFHPLTEMFRGLAGVAPSDLETRKSEKYAALFETASADDRAHLLDVAGGTSAEKPAPREPPQARRRATLQALVRFFRDRAAQAPLLLLVEDLHWCDPTTLEVLDLLAAGIADLPLMLLATTRPEQTYRFADRPHVSLVALRRLAREEADALVGMIFDQWPTSDALLDFIEAHTDGVPLFIEELCRSLRESGVLIDSPQGLRLDERKDLSAIPSSLHGILMERLDKLGPAKRVAQIASCIGRDFDSELLGMIGERGAGELTQALNVLVQSDLVVTVGNGPARADYSFRHALVRDVAYSSLLRSDRKEIHGAIAGLFESLDSRQSIRRPEILAYHLANAQKPAAAIRWWHEAAVEAKLRSANDEAVADLLNALRLLDQLPNEAERDNQEFLLLIELIAPYRASKGFAAPEVAAVTDRAIELADRARDAKAILPLLYNQWVYKFVSAHRDVARSLAESILARCDYDEDNLLRMTGLRALAATDFTRGRLAEAVENFGASIALYSKEQQSAITQALGLDALVAASGYNSLACWCLGRTDEARASIDVALAHAQALGHASTLAFAVYHHTLLRGVLERDAEVLRANGTRLEAIGQDNHFKMWMVCGRLLRSMGDCLAETTGQSLEMVIGHLGDFQDMGVVYRPTYEAFIAESWLKLGESARGLGHIARARKLMAESGELWNESEVTRLEGELRRLQGGQAAEAHALIVRAASIAAARGAVSFEAKARAALGSA